MRALCLWRVAQVLLHPYPVPKGLQLGDGHPVDYLRLEHRFAPTKAHEKAQLSTMTPAQMVGLRPVSRDLTEKITALAVAPSSTATPKEKAPGIGC